LDGIKQNKMTKKDYILIASVIKREYTSIDRSINAGQAMQENTKDIVFSLCGAFKTENPKFNKMKFEEACGIIEA
jgi:hypothetical protein